MDKLSTLANHRFGIIGGGSKAGTTSVFNYLADHPEICAADAKETRFFLDADYPLPSKLRYARMVRPHTFPSSKARVNR